MTDKDKWQALQSDIHAFTESVFGKSTVEAKLHHLSEEVQELMEDPADRMEWADCVILLIDSAAKQGLSMDDLYAAVQEKMAINKKRKWLPPDERGVVKHLKETG